MRAFRAKCGAVAEWSKALAWKVSIRQNRIEGSNPSRSASLIHRNALSPDSRVGSSTWGAAIMRNFDDSKPRTVVKVIPRIVGAIGAIAPANPGLSDPSPFLSVPGGRRRAAKSKVAEWAK